MESQHAAIEPWVILVFLIGLPVCFFLFFKSFRAKTRKAYWTYNALIVLTMLGFFALLSQSGLMPPMEELRQHRAEAPSPQEAFSKLPTPFLVASGLAGLIWLGGANLVMIRQKRKAGRSWWECINPLNPPFRDMDGKAWLQIALLAVLAFAVFAVGVNIAEDMNLPAIADPAAN